MSDEPENDMIVPGLQEAAAVIPPARGQQKRMKTQRYLMERICQLEEDPAVKTTRKICATMGISMRTLYRLKGKSMFSEVQEKYRNKALERAEIVKVLSASDALDDFRQECKAILEECKPKLRLMVQSEDERLAMDALRFVVEQVAALESKTPDALTQGMLDALPTGEEVQ